MHTQPFFNVDPEEVRALRSLTFNLSTFELLLPFTSLPSLRDLVIAQCLITVVPTNTFAALERLTLLRIMDSKVKIIQPGAFRGLSSLLHLALKGLEYDSLPTGVFDDLTSLTGLSLNRPPLITLSLSLVALPSEAFRSLTKLELLHVVGHTSLGVFLESWNQSNWEPFTQSLLDLNLDRNRFSRPMIPEFVFLFPNLRNLSLSYSRIQRIPMGTFDRVTKLQRLTLQMNTVSTIQREVFASMPALTHLDMRGCPATCSFQPDNSIACSCSDLSATRSVDGSCAPWCPPLETLELHVMQGPVTDNNYCDILGPEGNCQWICEPGNCTSHILPFTATCNRNGKWFTDTVCKSNLDCSNVVDDGTSSSASDTDDVSAAVVVPLALVAIIVAGIMAVLVRRRTQRVRATSAMRMELRSVIAQCVQTAFQRDYGHAVHDLRDQSVSFEALEVPVTAVRRERIIGQGESGEVWLGTIVVTSVSQRAPSVSSTDLSPPMATFGILMKGSSPSLVAVKLCERTDAQAQVQVLLEAHVLHLLRHEHIVSLVAVVTTHVPVLVCTEYMPGGDLKTFLRACRPTNETVKVVLGSEDFDRMATQVCSALAFLEEKRILHRDIAARNVLVNADGSVVKLSDLGAARDVYRTEEYIKTNSSSARLPIAWMAPESLRDNVYTHKSDVWSFGVLLWELTSFARAPYGALGPREIAEEVAVGNRLAQPAACTMAMYAVMNRCWATASSDRPCFTEVGMMFNRQHANRRLLTLTRSPDTVDGDDDDQAVSLYAESGVTDLVSLACIPCVITSPCTMCVFYKTPTDPPYSADWKSNAIPLNSCAALCRN